MTTPTYIATENGQIITTEGGSPIEADLRTSNGDIQLFDFSVNLLQALLWQYNNAPNIQSLVNSKNNWYFENQEQFWGYWFNNVFNLETADDFGLAVWSIILGQPTYINNAPGDTSMAFGWGSNRMNFGNGNFCPANGSTYQLPAQWARLLLQLRYFQLTSAGTVPEINRMLKYLFALYGPAWCVDNLDMTMTYYFDFAIPSGFLMILQNFDILPRPSGVKLSWQQGNFKPFGWGSNRANFGNGPFLAVN